MFNNIDKLKELGISSIDLNKVHKISLQKDLYEFIKYYWDTFDGAELKELWLMEYQAECFMYSVRSFLPSWITDDWITDDKYHELKLELDGECPIRDTKGVNNHDWNMPPRHSKSTTHNVCGPVWLNTITPKEIASVSHKEALATDMNTKRQKIFNSQKFKEMFADDPGLEVIKNSAKDIHLKHGGKLYSVNMASFTGFGGDIIINDDIVSTEHGKKDKEVLENAKSYYRNTLPTRRNQGDSSIVWNIQQRIAPGDISGMIREDEELSATYSKTVIQAINEKEKTIIFPCTGKIKVLEAGEYLWPDRFGNYKSIRAQVGKGAFETQYLQNPINSELTYIKEHMIHWITQDEYQANYVMNGARKYASFDFPVKGKDNSDFTGCVFAEKHMAKTAITSGFKERMGYPQQKRYVTNLAKSEDGIIQIYEDKANGSVLVQDLENEVSGIAMFEPGTKSKEQRVDIASNYFESGNIEFVMGFDEETGKNYKPKKLLMLISDLLRFPFIKHDDIVDAMSQLVLYLYTDVKLKVYGREFDTNNIIRKYTTNGPIDLLVYKVGTNWKVNEIVLDYSINSFIVTNEYEYNGKDSEILPKIIEHSKGKRMVYDAKGTEVYNLMMGKIPMMPVYYTLLETIGSVQNGLTANKIKIMSHCKKTIASMETFRWSKKSVENGEPKPLLLNDGFAGNIRVHIASNKGRNAIFY